MFIRYAAQRNPNGTWTAYTAIPSGPIAPTDGHQFTNPSINFGGEHFGAGYYGAPSAVKYNWLIDDGTGALVHGPPVNVSTPVFVYYPPVVAQPVPQVQPVIVPPPPPAPPVFQFGDATWVKDIKTTTHNTNKVELVDLRDPDPTNPNAKDWANGEPAEVETEWRILQTEFANAGNPKGQLKGLPQDLPGGNEIITRRYEFYKYICPIDAESGEAMADQVGPDGIHGVGTVTYISGFDAQGEPIQLTVDLSTIEVVGEFFGAQMSGFDVAPALGLIDHIPDGELNVPYADRRVVIGEEAGFLATLTGALPDGTSFDPITGIFSGTPTVAGVFSFIIQASDIGGSYVSNYFTVTITDSGAAPVVHAISTSASPFNGGSTSGDGSYEAGTQLEVLAVATPGFSFASWTENGVEVSASASYTFTVAGDRALVANFTPITYSIATSSSPLTGGTTSGGGTVNHGDPVTVVASPSAGFTFVNWTEAGAVVSASSSFTFTATANHSLVANFTPVSTGGSIRSLHLESGIAGGSKSLGVIRLASRAPAGGSLVQLSSSNPAILRVPATVFIPAGQKSATFVVTTSPVAQSIEVLVTAQLGSSVEQEDVHVLKRRARN